MFRRIVFALVVCGLVAGQECPLPSISDGDATGESTEYLPRVTLATSKGDIVIELFTPSSTAAANFESYLKRDWYVFSNP